MQPVLFASLSSLLLASVAAQQARWQLPPHGAVVYRQQSDLPTSMSEQFAPVLLADELVDGVRLRDDPWSLAALAAWLAFDLRTWPGGGAIDVRFPRVEPYGEVRFVGRATPVVDGAQAIRGRLSRRPIAARDGDAEFLRVEQWYLDEGLDGALQIERRFDAERGLLTALTWSVDAEVTTKVGDRHVPRRLRATTRLDLDAVIAGRDAAPTGEPGLAPRITAAIDLAIAYDFGRLAGGTDAAMTVEESRGSFHGPALQWAALHGLARAGRRNGDAGVAEALHTLAGRRLTQVQGLSMAILALDGLHGAAAERQAALDGEPRPARQLAPALQRQLAGFARELMQAARQGEAGAGGARSADTLWWTFADDVTDWSNPHDWLGVLAMDAASRCGVAVPPARFAAMAHHLLATAMAAGPAEPVALRLERQAPATTAAGARTAAQQSGWSRGPAAHPGHAEGSSTAGAMAALLACRRHLQSKAQADRALCAAIDDAVAAGWSWLHRHWTPRHSPSDLSVLHQHRDEFALAMSFLLDESGVRWLGEHDLYFELALLLKVDQRGDGCVPTTVLDTPAALSLWRRIEPAVTQSGQGRAPAGPAKPGKQ